MGFLPRDPLFRDDTKGDACPPLESPAYEETCPDLITGISRLAPSFALKVRRTFGECPNRNMYLFNRAAAGASLTAKL